MSHDPERLLNLRADGDELERELLASIKHHGPPAQAKHDAWLGIAGRIAALGAAAGTAVATASTATATTAASVAGSAASVAGSAASVAGSAASSSTSAASLATSGAAAKAGLGTVAAASAGHAGAGTLAASGVAAKAGLGALASSTLAAKAAWSLAAGSLALGGYLAVQDAQPTAETRAPAPTAQLAANDLRARVAVAGRDDLAPTAVPPASIAPTPTAEARVAVPAAAPAQREVSPAQREATPAQRGAKPARALRPAQDERLSLESALLAAARAQLQAGDTRGAGATLERLRVRFARGVLVQEREVLAIELLAAQGRDAAAARRARAFVRAYPRSPHSAKLSRFSDAP